GGDTLVDERAQRAPRAVVEDHQRPAGLGRRLSLGDREREAHVLGAIDLSDARLLDDAAAVFGRLVRLRALLEDWHAEPSVDLVEVRADGAAGARRRAVVAGR